MKSILFSLTIFITVFSSCRHQNSDSSLSSETVEPLKQCIMGQNHCPDGYECNGFDVTGQCRPKGHFTGTQCMIGEDNQKAEIPPCPTKYHCIGWDINGTCQHVDDIEGMKCSENTDEIVSDVIFCPEEDFECISGACKKYKLKN